MLYIICYVYIYTLYLLVYYIDINYIIYATFVCMECEMRIFRRYKQRDRLTDTSQKQYY